MEINGYPNYEILPDGRIWSKNRRKVITSHLNSSGYYRVSLSKNGKSRSFFIHRLVAEHYIPNPDNKPIVDHISGSRTRNHFSNLIWVDEIQKPSKSKKLSDP